MLVLRKKRVCNNSKKLRRGSSDVEDEQERKAIKHASLSRGTSMIINDVEVEQSVSYRFDSLIENLDTVKEDACQMKSDELYAALQKRIEKVVVNSKLQTLAKHHINSRPLLLLRALLEALISTISKTTLGKTLATYLKSCLFETSKIPLETQRKRVNWRIVREKERAELLSKIQEE